MAGNAFLAQLVIYLFIWKMTWPGQQIQFAAFFFGDFKGLF